MGTIFNNLFYELKPVLTLWTGLAALNHEPRSVVMISSGLVLIIVAAVIGYARLEYRGYIKR